MPEQLANTSTKQDMPEEQTLQSVRAWLNTKLNLTARLFAGDRRMRNLTQAFLDMWKEHDVANHQLEGQQRMRHAVTAQLQQEQQLSKMLAALISMIVLATRSPVSVVSRDEEEQSIRLVGNLPIVYTVYFGEAMELVTSRPGMLDGHFRFDDKGQLAQPQAFRKWMTNAVHMPATSGEPGTDVH